MSETKESAPGVLIQRDGGVVILTLNAPDKRNALIAPVREGLIAALDQLDTDPDCRVIVITGAGKGFCAGGDIGNVGPMTPLDVRERLRPPQRLVERVIHHSKPIIAAVEGPAFGAGLALATACDFVAASETATFCAAYGRIGVMADLGLLWSLPQRVSMGVVREIVMFCDVMKGDQAKSLGLVDWLAPEGKALEFALEKARRLANSATASISVTKALLARAPLDLKTVLAAEVEGQAVLSTTEDQQEGIRAFAEKRPAQFKGR